MSANLKLQYFTPGLGPGEVICFEESEKELLGNLQDSWGECPSTLWDLANFCSKTGQQERALNFVTRLLKLTETFEQIAHCLLMSAQIAEELEEYESAKAFYELGLKLEPLEDSTLYFLNNNFGCLLNHLGQFEEAEPHLERAISIEPLLLNGHKNLGIAREGLGRIEEAVECYITATQVGPYDARSLVHLENLLSRQPELFVKAPHLQSRLDRLRKDVENAQSGIPDVTIH
jgi:tetratricopeptide (TPR) repeat protein